MSPLVQLHESAGAQAASLRFRAAALRRFDQFFPFSPTITSARP